MSYLRIKTNAQAPRQYTLRFNNQRWHILNKRTYEVIDAFFDKREAERFVSRLA